jgi:hypothetical protein
MKERQLFALLAARTTLEACDRIKRSFRVPALDGDTGITKHAANALGVEALCSRDSDYRSQRAIGVDYSLLLIEINAASLPITIEAVSTQQHRRLRIPDPGQRGERFITQRRVGKRNSNEGSFKLSRNRLARPPGFSQ